MSDADSSVPATFYAKSDPPTPLDTHLQEVAGATVAALDSPAVARAVHPVNTTPARLRELGKLTGLLHDTGKAHPTWQAACQHAIETGDDVTLPHHSARSALAAFGLTEASETIPILRSRLTPIERTAVVLSILHHHTPISRKNQTPDGTLVDTTKCDEFFENLSNMETFACWEMQDDGIGAVVRTFTQRIESARTMTAGSESFDKLASLTTLLRSALIQADHHASSQGRDGPLAPLPQVLTDETVDFYDDLRPFQQTVADTLTSMDPPTQYVGLAGCGAGKTHTALQWGVEQCRVGNADRLVIAMPTQTTSNNLFHAITSDHVDPSDVALYHSTSDRLYTETLTNERELETVNEYSRRCKWFQQPITICTVDHLLATLVNNDKHSDIARGNLRRAAIVFDEIHAYDKQLLQTITGAVEHFTNTDIPWYVMTATCPPELEEALAPSETDEDPREDHAPYRVEHHDTDLTAETVATSLDDSPSRTAMVVKNTVRGAQRLAHRLDDQTPSDVVVTYYSSEFPLYDRSAKEQEVRDHFAPGNVPPDERRILVCTQVCELSLDISVDTLYTDLAPVDAVIQRAGRLHRRGYCPDSQPCDCVDCTVRSTDHSYICHTYFDRTAPAWYPYATGRHTPEWKLLLDTRDILDAATTYSYENARHWMADVYADYDLQLLVNSFYRTITNDALFGAPRWEGDRIEFRTDTHRRLAVVVSEYDLHDHDGQPVPFSELWDRFETHTCRGQCGLGEEHYTSCHEALQTAIDAYSIEIPTYWVLNDEISCHSSDAFPDAPRVSLPLVTLSYSYERGVQDPRENATTAPSRRDL